MKYLLCIFLLLLGQLCASTKSLKLLYERQANLIGHDWVYCEDMEQHRKEFFKWVALHDLWDSYSRVIVTVSCPDADYIPKCENAGKVFVEDNVPYQVMHNGIKVLRDCYYATWMTDLIYGLKGLHEPQEEKVFYEVLPYIPPNAVMLELGSYWAYYSLWFSKDVPGAKNYLIEPDLERLNTGKRNFALNQAKGTFFHGYVGAGERNSDSGDSKDVPRILIDGFLKENNIEHLDILHADIQGSEYDMLLSAIESIQQKKIDYFFISTHGENVHRRCLDFLQAHDFFIIAEHSPGESFSVDGLIAARRSDLPGCGKIPISKRS